MPALALSLLYPLKRAENETSSKPSVSSPHPKVCSALSLKYCAPVNGGGRGWGCEEVQVKASCPQRNTPQGSKKQGSRTRKTWLAWGTQRYRQAPQGLVGHGRLPDEVELTGRFGVMRKEGLGPCSPGQRQEDWPVAGFRE